MWEGVKDPYERLNDLEGALLRNIHFTQDISEQLKHNAEILQQVTNFLQLQHDEFLKLQAQNRTLYRRIKALERNTDND